MVRWPAAITLSAAALLIFACSPAGPEGVDPSVLDREIGRRIGDPLTCVLLAERGSGKIVYRYGTNTVCARTYPGCQGQAERTVEDLLKNFDPAAEGRRAGRGPRPGLRRGDGGAAGPAGHDHDRPPGQRLFRRRAGIGLRPLWWSEGPIP